MQGLNMCNIEYNRFKISKESLNQTRDIINPTTSTTKTKTKTATKRKKPQIDDENVSSSTTTGDDKTTTPTHSSSSPSFFDFDLDLASLDMPAIDLLNTDSYSFFNQLDGFQFESELAELEEIGRQNRRRSTAKQQIVSNTPPATLTTSAISGFETSTPTDQFNHQRHASDSERRLNESYSFLFDDNSFNTNGNNLMGNEPHTSIHSDLDKIIVAAAAAAASYRSSNVAQAINKFKLNDYVCINQKKFGLIKFLVCYLLY